MTLPHRRSTFSVIFLVCCGLLVLVTNVTKANENNSSERGERRNSTDSSPSSSSSSLSLFRRVSRDRRRYCGKQLTDTLALVCTSYPSPWRKKSVPTFNDEDSLEGSYREQLINEIKQDLDELEQLSPEMFYEQQLQFHPYYPRSYWLQPEPIDSHRRVRRQIVDECCRKSCTIKTLKQYCAD